MKNPYWFPEEDVGRLQNLFTRFLEVCEVAVEKYESLRSREDVASANALNKGFKSLQEALVPCLDPSQLEYASLLRKRRRLIAKKIEEMISARNRGRLSSNKHDSIQSTSSKMTSSSGPSFGSKTNSVIAPLQPIPVLPPPPPPGYFPPPLNEDGFSSLLADAADDDDEETRQQQLAIQHQEQLSQLPSTLRPAAALDGFLFDAGVRSAWDIYLMPDPLNSQVFTQHLSNAENVLRDQGIQIQSNSTSQTS